MSVNSKMKAIADPIRMLRNGFASEEKLTLDEMATGLERTVTDINDAYDVIGNKGGTVPSTQATCNLVSAINSIPNGAEIITVSGKFTTNSKGEAVVTLGFKPDLVYVKSSTRTMNGYTFDASVAMAFDVENRTNTPYTTCRYIMNGYDMIIDTMWQQNNNGFGVSMSYTYGNTSAVLTSATIDYIAVKYT